MASCLPNLQGCTAGSAPELLPNAFIMRICVGLRVREQVDRVQGEGMTNKAGKAKIQGTKLQLCGTDTPQELNHHHPQIADRYSNA